MEISLDADLEQDRRPRRHAASTSPATGPRATTCRTPRSAICIGVSQAFNGRTVGLAQMYLEQELFDGRLARGARPALRRRRFRDQRSVRELREHGHQRQSVRHLRERAVLHRRSGRAVGCSRDRAADRADPPRRRHLQRRPGRRRGRQARRRLRARPRGRRARRSPRPAIGGIRPATLPACQAAPPSAATSTAATSRSWTAPAGRASGNYGFYLLVDQMVYREGGRRQRPGPDALGRAHPGARPEDQHDPVLGGRRPGLSRVCCRAATTT